MATFSGDVQYSQYGTVTNPCVSSFSTNAGEMPHDQLLAIDMRRRQCSTKCWGTKCFQRSGPSKNWLWYEEKMGEIIEHFMGYDSWILVITFHGIWFMDLSDIYIYMYIYILYTYMVTNDIIRYYMLFYCKWFSLVVFIHLICTDGKCCVLSVGIVFHRLLLFINMLGWLIPCD